MPENGKDGGNGLADLLTVDLLAERVQYALERVQAAEKPLRRLLPAPKKRIGRPRRKVLVTPPGWEKEGQACLRNLEEAESGLYVANYLAGRIRPEPQDEAERNLRAAACIAVSGISEFPFTSLPNPTTKRRGSTHTKPPRG